MLITVTHKKVAPVRRPILTIITVVMDDCGGLVETSNSINILADRGEVEYLVWINAGSKDLNEHIKSACAVADIVVSGPDDGIFDAMNKSLELCSGDFVLFLNAKDRVVQSFPLAEIEKASLIPVTYIDYFSRRRRVNVSKTLKFGIPYCHQGMILPRAGYSYDIRYKFGADYLALINFNLDWPLPMLGSGLIEYDTSGVSTVNRWESDLWTARVIWDRYGKLLATAYVLFCAVKIGVKRVYDIKLKLFGSKVEYS